MHAIHLNNSIKTAILLLLACISIDVQICMHASNNNLTLFRLLIIHTFTFIYISLCVYIYIYIGIDYKVLMTGEGDPMDTLGPALTANNVHIVAKLADKIPVKVHIIPIYCNI